MPEIYRYLGLSFYLFPLEQHTIPHVHVYYGEYCISIAVDSLEVLAGYLPAKKRKQAELIIQQNQNRLQEMYRQAKEGLHPGKL